MPILNITGEIYLNQKTLIKHIFDILDMFSERR